MSIEKAHKGKLIMLSEEDDDQMLESTEDEAKVDTMASGECRKQKKARSAKLHNFTEKLRRRRLKEKMNCLQELIPNCSRRDKASVLDDAIKYIKNLQYQLQIMWMSQGYSMSNVACMMQSPMHIHRPLVQLPPNLPPFPRPGGDHRGEGDGVGIGNLTTLPPINLGAVPELFSMPTLPQAWEPAAFPIHGGISEDVAIPKHDNFLESLFPLTSNLGTASSPLAESNQMQITSDESSSFFSC